jgi:2-oxoglutarate dehydrogenase E1 component
VEQLYPFPIVQLREILASYPNAKQVVWVQEEPENMGAWRFVDAIVWPIKNSGYDWRHVSRVESGSPAPGSKTIHDQETASILEQTFANW